MRLLWKILLLSMIVAVVPLFVAGWNIISRVRDAFVYSTENAKLESVVSGLAYHIDQNHLLEWREFLNAVDHMDPAALVSTSASTPAPSLAAMLETQEEIALLRVYPDMTGTHHRVIYNWTYAEKGIANPANRVYAGMKLAESDTAGARIAARAGRPYLSGPFRVRGVPGCFVNFAIPRVSGGRPFGAVVATMSLAGIQRDIEDLYAARQGIVYVIDSHGRTVAHPDTSVIASSDAASRSRLGRTVLASLTAHPANGDSSGFPLSRRPATGSTASGDRGVGYAYAVCDGAPWAVVALKPLGNALEPAFRVIREVLFWLALGLGLAIVGGLVLSRAINRPVKLLVDGARAVGDGDFAHRIALASKDEFGELAEAFNHMAGRLQTYDQINVDRIVREKSKTDAIIRNIADGVVVTGTRDEVLLINEPAERWFGVVEKDVFDQPAQSAIGTEGFAELIADTRLALDGIRSRDFIVKIPGRVQETVLHARAARVAADRGEFVGIITVLRDVTSEREIDRMKTDIVSVVAHELRSPLVSIMGYSGILREEDLDWKTRTEFARIINDESNRMVEMINKYLDISRIESGKTEIVRVPTDLGEVARHVIDINRGQADARNIRVEFTAPRRLTPIMIDPNLIGQAILNLFSNAIKYSPSDTVVSVTITEHRDEVEIAISDQGFGIAEAAKARLFERFFRAEEDPRVRQTKGTGLGLTLVKEIVDHHGGRVRVESEMNKGSTFAILLPKRWD